MAIKLLENRIVPPMMFELVRDRIAEILIAELVNQVNLAIADGADPTPYEISITTEKTDPWNSSQFPLVNVWYDTGNIDTAASPADNNQQGDHFYNLDCYVERPSEDSGGDIIHGDELSAKEVQQVAGIIWQIIMADQNTRLQFESRSGGKPSALVAARIFEALSTFQPSFGETPVENVQAMRLRLKVRHVEIPPVTLGVTLHDGLFVIKQSDRTQEPEDEVEVTLTP